jgi:hypothetical protein
VIEATVEECSVVAFFILIFAVVGVKAPAAGEATPILKA